MTYVNIDQDRRCRQVWYDTLQDVVRQRPSRESGYTARHAYHWTGCPSRSELDNLALNGWDEGVVRAAQLNGSLTAPKLKNVRRVKRRADFGDNLDMQAVYGGQLDRAWETARREITLAQAGGAITLAVCIGAHCGKTPEEIFWTGAVAIRLVDALVQSGRNVRVLAYEHSDEVYVDKYVSGTETVFVVKEYTDPVDLSRMIVTLGHAGFLRDYVFSSLAAPSIRCHGNLGYPKHNGLPKLLTDREQRNNIVNIFRVWSQHEAQALLADTLARFQQPEAA